jgi:hypothetical protein
VGGEGLSPDANLVFVYDSQQSGYVDALEKKQGSTNRLTDSLLGRRMHLQSDNTQRMLGRKAHYIREIGI